RAEGAGRHREIHSLWPRPHDGRRGGGLRRCQEPADQPAEPDDLPDARQRLLGGPWRRDPQALHHLAFQLRSARMNTMTMERGRLDKAPPITTASETMVAFERVQKTYDGRTLVVEDLNLAV